MQTKPAVAKTLVLHVILFSGWLGLQNLSLFETWKLTNKSIWLYNNISLACVFYGVYFSARSYFGNMTYMELFKRSGFFSKMIYLLARWQPFCWLAIILTYVYGSWLIDKYVFKLDYPYFSLYCYGRWNVESSYILIAIGVSFLIEYIKRENQKIIAMQARIISLEEHIRNREGEQSEALQKLSCTVRNYLSR
jgi:hypothetical protein